MDWLQPVVIDGAAVVANAKGDVHRLASQADPKPLPSPAEFEPARYLGKWFEVARLPTPSQPEGSVAIAEYSAGNVEGTVKVKNSAYDAEGEFIGAIEGKAQIAEGEAKGRLPCLWLNDFSAFSRPLVGSNQTNE